MPEPLPNRRRLPDAKPPATPDILQNRYQRNVNGSGDIGREDAYKSSRTYTRIDPHRATNPTLPFTRGGLPWSGRWSRRRVGVNHTIGEKGFTEKR